MKSVTMGCTVTISYIGTLDDGTIFYSSDEHGPVTVKLGAEQLFPALEQAILGMEAGETRNIELTAAQCYGPRRRENLIRVPRQAFPEGRAPAPGQKLSVDFAGGRSRVMRVAGVSESEVTLDGNHALAGRDLCFALRVDRVEG